MIISRTPFRISFAGGGSDLSSFYRKELGAVVSTSIDKYMYIAIHPFFDKNKIQLKYSKTELVDSINDIRHPIFREVLSHYDLKGIDLNSIADVPAGTGLGSSSSFTVGLLNVVNAYLSKAISTDKLAELACEVEINKVGSLIGKQDQYAAAFGGLNFITFYGDESVKVEKIIMKPEVKKQLQDNLIMIHVGGEHSANEILKEQQLIMNGSTKFNMQKQMVHQAFQLKTLLENNCIDDFGRYLHEGWMMKKKLTYGISNDSIDRIYQRGLDAGALGGKLLGAGGAGFVLFYCPEEKQESFRNTMKDLHEMKIAFDTSGSKIIYLQENL
ncbi:MAG: GHMP family kinase ATP-binding protein [Paludibacteraceae bacterium]